MSPLRVQLDRIRRRAWLVLAIMLLAGFGATAASLGQETTYTGRATLTIISQNRAPEQDAPLAAGYAEYFNETSYQEVLRQNTDVPGGITFRSRTAATSPIIYIEATAPSPELAATAATTMAQAFVADLNANLQAEQENALAELRNRVTEERALLPTIEQDSPEASLSTQTIASLQNLINQKEADTSNRLQELQLSAGVSENATNPIQNIVLGLIGGLILGCVGALGFATVENRIGSAYDVRDRLGRDTLLTVPGGRSKSARDARAECFKRLATVISLSDLERPATIAVVAPRVGDGTRAVAQGLAYYRALQGERTLLVHADLHPPHRTYRQSYEDHQGVAELLSGTLPALDDRILPTWCATMQILPAGNPQGDPYSLFSREQFANLIQHATKIADLVVVDTPPIIEAAEAQVICAAVDGTILVIEEDATRATDAAEADRLLNQVDAVQLGVVLVGSPIASGHPPEAP